MLTAAASKTNKLRLEKGSLCEDEITSTVFGPLAYMTIENAWNIMREIAEAAGIAIGIPQSTEVDEFNPKFWPRHGNDKLLDARSYVEPDVVFHFHFRDGSTLNVLIEVKWGATLNPRCELIRQWLTRPSEKEPWIHLYLVTQQGQGRQDLQDSIAILSRGCSECRDNTKCTYERFLYPTDADKEANDWRECQRAISWHHIQKLADDLSKSDKMSEVVKRWGKGVRNFLTHEGYVPFTGFAFSWLTAKDTEEILKCKAVFFHREPMFDFLDGILISCDEFEMVFFHKASDAISRT